MRKLTRRSYVKSIPIPAAILLAGCSSPAFLSQEKRISIEEPSVPSEFPGELRAQVTNQVGKSSPPSLKFTYRNTTGDRVNLTCGFPAPFSQRVLEETSRNGLLYLGDDSIAVQSDEESCWNAPEFEYPTDTRTWSFLPGQEVAVTFIVLNDSENAECYPSGEYKLSESYTHEGKEFVWEPIVRIHD